MATGSADERFRALAHTMGLDPDDVFVGGYVDWEWNHSRHVFEALGELAGVSVQRKRVLEFGCHSGATAVVLAHLGANVTGVDVDPVPLSLARLNAKRFGCGKALRFRHLADSTRLPFHDGEFDLITCNSVLEYVRPHLRPTVLAELDRVLAPRGLLVVMGTSNRLWPREVHSRRLVNYLPRALDGFLFGKRVLRGVNPWMLQQALIGYEDLCVRHPALYPEMTARMNHRRDPRYLKVAARVLRTLKLSPGMLARSFTLVLQKP